MKENLRALRTEKGVSQTDVAKYLGLSRQAYNHYETGRREPDSKLLISLAKYFHTSTDYILGLTDNPAPVDEIAAASVANGGTYTDLTPENIAAIQQLKGLLHDLPELQQEE